MTAGWQREDDPLARAVRRFIAVEAAEKAGEASRAELRDAALAVQALLHKGTPATVRWPCFQLRFRRWGGRVLVGIYNKPRRERRAVVGRRRWVPGPGQCPLPIWEER